MKVVSEGSEPTAEAKTPGRGSVQVLFPAAERALDEEGDPTPWRT
jgi:hypothetical protein